MAIVDNNNKKPANFELFLFSTVIDVVNEVIRNGVNGIIVDLETKGKQTRQSGYDTQINQNTIDDISRIKTMTPAKVITRINGFWTNTSLEIHQSLDCGTDEIFLPMVRTIEEVETCLRIINDKCKLGILVETMDAVKICSDLCQLPLSRVYVGLNDLAIDRKLSNIFISLSDGTVENIRKNYKIPFGFGGLTLPDKGNPIPCGLLMSEMARLDTQFTFLRRSFFRDTSGINLNIAIPRILQALKESFNRPMPELEQDHREFVALVGKIDMGFQRDA
jgi:hypothetical protein